MRRIILAILTFILCLSWAEVKVEKVLETTSIKEYNQWAKKNKAKYPGLRPFFVKTERLKKDKEWMVYYYDENGDLTKKELLKAKPGWWLHVGALSYEGIVSVTEWDSSLGECAPNEVTIKNSRGNKLFSFAYSFDYPTGAGVRNLPGGIGLFRSRPYGFPNERNCYAELLAWNGKLIGRIENLCGMNIGSKATPDGKYMMLNSGFTAVAVKNGKELWRKTYPSAIEVGISNDGSFIAIGDAGAVFVYNQQGELLYSVRFSPLGSMTNPRPVFSSDNKYLVTSLPMELSLIDNVTGKLLWQQQVEGDAYYSAVYFANHDKYIVLGYLGRIFVYDLAGNLLKTIKDPQIGSRWEVVDDLIIIDSKTEVFKRVIYQLK